MRGLIYGATRENVEFQFNELIKNYKTYWEIEPEELRKSSNELYVRFKNGDIWQGFRCHADNVLGRKANVVLVDRNLNSENLFHRILCTYAPPYSAIGYF